LLADGSRAINRMGEVEQKGEKRKRFFFVSSLGKKRKRKRERGRKRRVEGNLRREIDEMESVDIKQ